MRPVEHTRRRRRRRDGRARRRSRRTRPRRRAAAAPRRRGLRRRGWRRRSRRRRGRRCRVPAAAPRAAGPAAAWRRCPASRSASGGDVGCGLRLPLPDLLLQRLRSSARRRRGCAPSASCAGSPCRRTAPCWRRPSGGRPGRCCRGRSGRASPGSRSARRRSPCRTGRGRSSASPPGTAPWRAAGRRRAPGWRTDRRRQHRAAERDRDQGSQDRRTNSERGVPHARRARWYIGRPVPQIIEMGTLQCHWPGDPFA